MLAILVVATLALDFIMFTRRLVPAKYVVIGAILLTVFQIIPIIYTVSIAFTNYSTGHIGTKEEAIQTIETDSLSETEGSVQYEMLPLYAESEAVVLALTEIPNDTTTTDTTTTDTTGASAEASPEASVQTEFGGDASAAPEASAAPAASPEASVQTEFGAGEVASGVASPEASLGAGEEDRGRHRARGWLAADVHRHERGPRPRTAGRCAAR